MKTPALLLAVALVATASPTLAQTDPGGRIQELTYAPNGVYPISGAFRTATQIIFSPEETIRHAAIGDSVAWEVAAEGAVLFLKPRERHQSTNLLVVTERAGVARHYVFELLAHDRSAMTAAYQVRFRYPDDDQARAAAALAVSAQAAEARLMGLELQAGAIEGRRNLAYTVQGDPGLQPSEVTDNGRFTVLRFPGNQPVPAIFEVTGDGAERLVPYDVRGEFVVIHGAVSGLRLRHGGSVLCIYNEAFDPRGRATGTGTASPAVDRTVTGDRP
nr:TrbG/VirB9 family P-type conjugative transfer protein [uncultured Brevundimonas sp.]